MALTRAGCLWRMCGVRALAWPRLGCRFEDSPGVVQWRVQWQQHACGRRAGWGGAAQGSGARRGGSAVMVGQAWLWEPGLRWRRPFLAQWCGG